MVAVAAVGIALGASRLSQRDLFFTYEMSILSLLGFSPILICYLWLRDSPDQKSSIPIETLIARFTVVLAVGVVLWALFALLVAPFN